MAIETKVEVEDVPLWIDGNATTSEPGKTFPVNSASQNRVLHHAHSADIKAAIRAADSSWKAYLSWKKSTAIQRRDLVERVAVELASVIEELVSAQMEETSCSEEWARMNVNLAINSVKEVAGRITSISGEMPSSAYPGQLSLVFKEPVGPLLTITPWNAAVILSSRAITAPIAVGCTVIFKASELCPRTHFLLAQAWHRAGVPPGVLNVIQTSREDAAAVTEALIAHPGVRKIEFIGSRSIGKIIGAMCAQYTKPVFLELGGKGPAIVLDDANIDQAVHLCLMGAFLHHGQICFSTERIYVQAGVVDRFVAGVKARARDFPTGHAASLRLAQDANRKLIDAESKGAEFLIGGPGYEVTTGALKPTIVTGVNEDMLIFDEETFGPSASLYTFSDDDEAIRLANASEYGLNASVHTTNMHRGIEIARQLEYAQVHINNLTEFDEATIPVGGTKASGWGRSNAGWGFEEYLSLKTVTVNMAQVNTYI